MTIGPQRKLTGIEKLYSKTSDVIGSPQVELAEQDPSSHIGFAKKRLSAAVALKTHVTEPTTG